MIATIRGDATSYKVCSRSMEEKPRKPVAGLTTQQQFTAVRQQELESASCE